MNIARFLRFIHLSVFARKWNSLKLDDDALRQLENEIIKNPTIGKVVAGAGGIRKLRFSPAKSGRGKSGAYRVCYYYVVDRSTVLLVTVFSKDQRDNLSQAEKNEIKSLIRFTIEQLDR